VMPDDPRAIHGDSGRHSVIRFESRCSCRLSEGHRVNAGWNLGFQALHENHCATPPWPEHVPVWCWL